MLLCNDRLASIAICCQDEDYLTALFVIEKRDLSQ